MVGGLVALEELGLGHGERGRDEGRGVLGALRVLGDGLGVEDDDRDRLVVGFLVDALDLEDDADRDAWYEAPNRVEGIIAKRKKTERGAPGGAGPSRARATCDRARGCR